MTAVATLPVLFQEGDHASRPAASAVGSGALYSCTTHNLIYQTDGSTWTTWATLGGGTPDLDAVIAVSGGQDISDALSGAASPDAGNVFATMADVGGGATATAMAIDIMYTQGATNGTSHTQTITAVASGKRIIFVVNSRGRNHNTPTCTNVTFTNVASASISTTNFVTVWVGVATGTSGTSITVTATGSNWIIADTYIVSDTLTPTAGNTATLTDTSASAAAGTPIGPIALSVGDAFVVAVAQDDGSNNLTGPSATMFSVPCPRGGSGVALVSAIGRSGATKVFATYGGGTGGSDMCAVIGAVT